MHIMHVIDSLAIGGAERMLVDIANSTAASGHRVSVCVTRSEDALAQSLRPEVDCWELDRRARLDLGAMRRFAHLVSDQAIEVLHAHGRSTLSFLAALRTLGYIRLPVVLHDHAGLERDGSVPAWLRAWGSRYIAQYVGVYEKQGVWALRAGIPPGRIHIIGNAIDLERIRRVAPADIRRQFQIDDGSLIGLVVGGIRPEKGIDILLKALAQCQCTERLRVLIVGGVRDPAYAAACRTQCTKLGLEATVRFVGERLDVPELLHAADFALIPSRCESGPLVLIECLTAGLPFVATAVGGVAEQVSREGLPEIVPPDDAGALARGIERLAALSTEERQARVSLGRRIAAERFDIRQVMPRWHGVYRQALEEAPI